MMINKSMLSEINALCATNQVLLIAVTKTHPVEIISAAYAEGLLDFGENRAQEMVSKQPLLPADIRWHMIGHMQTNKVKQLAPFVHMIHSVDSLKLLKEIDKEAEKNTRIIKCLLQVHIAREETKFGFDDQELIALFEQGLHLKLPNIQICGLMGMATFTDDMKQVRYEFKYLFNLFKKLKEEYFKDQNHFCEISMGMSSDYRVAIEEGSTMIRVGSLLFGSRN